MGKSFAKGSQFEHVRKMFAGDHFKRESWDLIVLSNIIWGKRHPVEGPPTWHRERGDPNNRATDFENWPIEPTTKKNDNWLFSPSFSLWAWVSVADGRRTVNEVALFERENPPRRLFLSIDLLAKRKDRYFIFFLFNIKVQHPQEFAPVKANSKWSPNSKYSRTLFFTRPVS